MPRRYSIFSQWRYVHESLIILLIAGPFAVFLPYMMDSSSDKSHIEEYKISPKIAPTVIFNYLLPPIIMSAGFNMRKKFFFKNIGVIGLFGFIGTVVNFCVVTGLFYFINPLLKGNSSAYGG
jgi:hypothetical protein